MSKAKNPALSLRALYVSTAGRKIVSVVPQGNLLTIGNESWKVGRNHLFPGKGKFDVVCVQGQSECLPVWEKTPIGPEEVDAIAHNNLLEQIHSLSKGNKTTAISWIQVGMSLLLFLAIVGVGVKLNGDFEDMSDKLDTLAPCPPNCANRGDTTTVSQSSGYGSTVGGQGGT
jgi:hypothetical protein